MIPPIVYEEGCMRYYCGDMLKGHAGIFYPLECLWICDLTPWKQRRIPKTIKTLGLTHDIDIPVLFPPLWFAGIWDVKMYSLQKAKLLTFILICVKWEITSLLVMCVCRSLQSVECFWLCKAMSLQWVDCIWPCKWVSLQWVDLWPDDYMVIWFTGVKRKLWNYYWHVISYSYWLHGQI